MLNPHTSALVNAGNWIDGMLTGSLATGLAVAAVAGVGFHLLMGRLQWQQAMRVVLGTFILFSAPQLVRELTAAVGANAAAWPGTPAGLLDIPPPPAPPPQDRYAGAAVPPE